MKLQKYASVALVFDGRIKKGVLIPRACIVEIDDGDDKHSIISKAERYCKEEHPYKDEIKGLFVVGNDYCTFEVNE